MLRFVTIIPLELWEIVLLLLFMWAAFGLNGFQLRFFVWRFFRVAVEPPRR